MKIARSKTESHFSLVLPRDISAFEVKKKLLEKTLGKFSHSNTSWPEKRINTTLCCAEIVALCHVPDGTYC